MNIGLEAGAVIHETNGNPILSVEALWSALKPLKRGNPLALLMGRDGKLLYVAYEIE